MSWEYVLYRSLVLAASSVNQMLVNLQILSQTCWEDLFLQDFACRKLESIVLANQSENQTIPRIPKPSEDAAFISDLAAPKERGSSSSTRTTNRALCRNKVLRKAEEVSSPLGI